VLRRARMPAGLIQADMHRKIGFLLFGADRL